MQETQETSKNAADGHATPAADLFAPRPGHSLSWSNVSFTAGDKTILNNLEGCIRPNEVCCIMGPSGSGKTSLLNVLAGKVNTGRNIKVEREIKLDGHTIVPSSIETKRKISFVSQHDDLPSTSTVREALTFSARLRSSKKVSDDDIESLVNQILKLLRLTSIADSRIGGPLLPGGRLSGGEMRRVSLGLELVVRPSILFGDEILSGLDSFNAETVMEIAKGIAESGAAVVLVVHQPTSKAFAMMDHLIFLREGRILYQGPGKQLANHMENCGLPVPMNYNPAEWIMQNAILHEEKFLKDNGLYESMDMKVPEASEHAMPRRRKLSVYDSLSREERIPQWKEFAILLKRDLKDIIFNSKVTGIRLGVIAFGAVMFAIIFEGIGQDSLEGPEAFLGHASALFFVAMGVMFVVTLALTDIEQVVPLFVREYTSSHYRMLPYALSTVTAEVLLAIVQALLFSTITYFGMSLAGNYAFFFAATLLFSGTMIALAKLVGALCRNPANAKEIAPVLLLPPVLLSGILVSTKSLPQWLQGWYVIFPFAYYTRLILYNEFQDCMEFTEAEQHVINCLTSARAGLGDLGAGQDSISAVYDQESTLRSAQTGIFMGTETIEEYRNFLSEGNNPDSALWFSCSVEGEFYLNLNEATADSCDITLATVFQNQLNQNRVSDELRDNSWSQFVIGHRIRYSYEEDLSGVTFETHDIYFPEAQVDNALRTEDPVKVARDVCEIMLEDCEETFRANNFVGLDDCIEQMAALPPATINEQGLETLQGNSLSCRALHAGLAVLNDYHCPHLSIVPIEDRSGNLICQNEGELNLSLNEFFDDRDTTLFRYAATSFGLDGDDQFRVIAEEDRSTCADTLVNVATVASNSALPDNAICAQYLFDRSATGKQNAIYWGVQWGMLLFFRIAAFGVLRYKASRATAN